ncbi:MAG: nuclear transport factor 2 family protein [Actinomycetota bacterium]|nr:nuclear transport factor 2 family protein [Actinomycetota bacterium]
MSLAQLVRGWLPDDFLLPLVYPGDDARVLPFECFDLTGSPLLGEWLDAFQRGDLNAVVALLTDDAKVTMPPEPIELRGRSAITDFYRSQGFWGRPLKVVPTGANQQPAFAYYLPDPNADLYRASGLLVLTVTGEHISAITRFGERDLLARFGLPRTLPADAIVPVSPAG